MSITRVAKLAGVSSSTVSRVINDHPRVAPDTVKAVREAMQQLSYVPSDRRPGPKPLRRHEQRTLNVAFLALGSVRGTATPGFSELLGGVSQAANQHGVRLSFSHVPDTSTLAQQLQNVSFDGLLLHGQTPDSRARDLLAGTPTVWLMGNRTRPDWGDQVMPDAYAIGELAARHLWRRGHRHMAFLNLESCFWPLRIYEHAFVTTAEELGATVVSATHRRQHVDSYWQPHVPEAVEDVVSRVLKATPRPTGLFVADDMQVAQIQPALLRRKVKIGQGVNGGVEIVSCNNELPYLAGLSPRPESIDIRLAAIGRRAIEQFIWRVKHRSVSERFCIQIEPKIAGQATPAVGG